MSVAVTGWQVGEPGYPVLRVDYNEDYDDEGRMLASVDQWCVRVGDRCYISDADGLTFPARVVGPWLTAEFVVVEIDVLRAAHEDSPAAGGVPGDET